MEVTKELVLESMNTYCTERKYGSETLTDGFKEKFSNFFVKKYAEKDVEDAEFKADLHFNLDTAFNASVDLKTAIDAAYLKKENEYKNQIAELNKKIVKPQEQQQQQFEIPDDVKAQLAELEAFKNKEAKKSKFQEIVELAKKGIRQDLHTSFDNYVKDQEVKLDETSEEQAKKLTQRFQDIFRDSIGDIKPLAPKVQAQRDDEYLASIPKVKVQ